MPIPFPHAQRNHFLMARMMLRASVHHPRSSIIHSPRVGASSCKCLLKGYAIEKLKLVGVKRRVTFHKSIKLILAFYCRLFSLFARTLTILARRQSTVLALRLSTHIFMNPQ